MNFRPCSAALTPLNLRTHVVKPKGEVPAEPLDREDSRLSRSLALPELDAVTIYQNPRLHPSETLPPEYLLLLQPSAYNAELVADFASSDECVLP